LSSIVVQFMSVNSRFLRFFLSIAGIDFFFFFVGLSGELNSPGTLAPSDQRCPRFSSRRQVFWRLAPARPSGIAWQRAPGRDKGKRGIGLPAGAYGAERGRFVGSDRRHCPCQRPRCHEYCQQRSGIFSPAKRLTAEKARAGHRSNLRVGSRPSSGTSGPFVLALAWSPRYACERCKKSICQRYAGKPVPSSRASCATMNSNNDN
jgi:hypothetical protein